MARNLGFGEGPLVRALLEARIAESRGGGLGALASIVAEPPRPQRKGLLPPVDEVIRAQQPGIIYVIWHGVSGTRYRTQLNPIGASYNAREGVYIFCKIAPNGNWDPVYVGETDSFKRRLTDELVWHHRWQSIRREGATHICTLHLTDGLTLREGVETDLRNQLNPPCNRQ